jgi:hypothetical protein
MSYVTRGRAPEDGAVVGGGGPDSLGRDDLPAVMEYLFLDHWEDGASRETSTLLVFVEDGRVKACLNDRQEERSLWVSSTSFLGALAALEDALRSGGADWRRSFRSKKKG